MATFSFRSKIALRVTALLLAIRWYNIVFLTLAQVALFRALHHTGENGPLLVYMVLVHALLIAGGSLINNFYDSEKDLINRPWRTLFERTVVRRYGIPLAFSFWMLAIGLSWGYSTRTGVFHTVYALALFVYSHKRNSLGRWSHVLAAGLAFLPLSGLGIALGGLPLDLLLFGFGLLCIEIARQSAKEARVLPRAQGSRESALVAWSSWALGWGWYIYYGPQEWILVDLFLLGVMIIPTSILGILRTSTWATIADNTGKVLHALALFYLIGRG